MKSKPIKRRQFLGYLLLLVALYRCKKDALTISKTVTPPITEVTDAYLGQYSTTDYGNALQPEPDFMSTINGYTDRVSYNSGDTVNVFLSGPASANAAITLHDTKGNIIQTISTPIVTQTINSTKPWVDGFGYAKTFSFQIPQYLQSGIYTWQGQIPFVCKGANQAADIIVVYPSNTTNAYNPAGGKSLYLPDASNRASVLSFLRSNVISYPQFYQWIDGLPYTIRYIADSDLDNYEEIANSKIVMITGHSEYWTTKARLNIDKFVDSGKNLLVLSGNTMWWQIRYNPGKNMMIAYKHGPSDPLGNTKYSSVSFDDPTVNYSVTNSIGADYTLGGYGRTLANRWDGYKIVQENSPLFAGAGLKNGDILSLKTTEYDCVPVVNMIAPGSTEVPVIDNAKLNYYKSELLGYDFAENLEPGDGLGLGTFIVGQRTPSSGVIVNVASMDWCNYIVYDQFKIITKNMIDLSLKGGNLFTT